MPALGSLVVQSAADYALDFYVRGPMTQQTIQDKPLIRFLEGAKKSFPGGKANISLPVKGANMNDTAGFFAGYTGDSTLTFTQKTLGVRAAYAWKEVHAGYVVTFTELLQDGITVTDGEHATSDNDQVTLTRLTGILKDAMSDFGEGWARAKNNMYWRDGSQDSNQVPGVLSLILDDPTSGTVGGLSQAANSWWRSRKNLSLAYSADNQQLSIFFRNEIIQLRRYGGRPNKALCGSEFWNALATEVQAKGIYTQSGFTGGTDIGIPVSSIKLEGVEFEYDPTLDDLGMAKRCYLFDSRRITLMPIEGNDNITYSPARPYNYFVFLKSMAWRGGLVSNQLNAMGVYGIA